jgi:hypothetical protein
MKTQTTKFALLTLALLLALSIPAFAADTVINGSISTVTPFAVTMSAGQNLDYGVAQMGTFNSEVMGTPATVTNDGTQPVDLYISGTQATNGTDTWALGDVQGKDTYVWKFTCDCPTCYCTECPNCAGKAVPQDTMAPLCKGLPAGQASQFITELGAPTESTGSGTYTFSATIYAIAQ